MPMQIEGAAIVLRGVVEVELAEALHQQLLQTPEATVAYEALEHVHAAAVQVLLAHGKPLPAQIFPAIYSE